MASALFPKPPQASPIMPDAAAGPIEKGNPPLHYTFHLHPGA